MPRIKKLWSHKLYGKGWTGYYDSGKKSDERIFLLVKEGRKKKHQYGSFQQAKDDSWRQR